MDPKYKLSTVLTRSTLISAALLPFLLFAQGYRTDSWSPYTHIITLYDRDGDRVDHKDQFEAYPYSPAITCGKCHNVDSVATGWHFNSVNPDVPAGKKGEPWIWTDSRTRTQIPLSYRGWSGTYNPYEVGISRWAFLKKFGRHMPGGGAGLQETLIDDKKEKIERWNIAGTLEMDCLFCHSASRKYDANEWAKQIEEENFTWAPVAASGLAAVKGNTRELPYDFDPEFPEFSSDPLALPPSTEYNVNAFEPNGRVFLDMVRKPDNERCYYCHSTLLTDEKAGPRFAQDMDIHMTQGMNCSDCHRNGIGHQVVRGYEGEENDSNNPAAGTLTCAACHIGDKDDDTIATVGGRHGAPVAEHKGLPPIHFEILACTACHSGPWPQDETFNMQTSMAHALGLSDEHRNVMDPPHIVEPVFVKQGDGKIAPHRLIYPSFWASMKNDTINPLPVKDVEKRVVRLLRSDDAEHYPRGWKPVTEAEMLSVLSNVQSYLAEDVTAVYITGGKVHRMDSDTTIAVFENPAAQPYSWPLAHDVRGAGQSLGARGCGDCHSTDSPMFFSEVRIDSLMASPAGENVEMGAFSGLNPAYAKIFALTFIFRPWLKVIAFAAVLILVVVLVLRGFSGMLDASSELTDKKQN